MPVKPQIPISDGPINIPTSPLAHHNYTWAQQSPVSKTFLWFSEDLTHFLLLICLTCYSNIDQGKLVDSVTIYNF